MTNPDQNARPKLSRREFLKTAGAVGGSLVVSGLVEACSKAITQAPTAIPIVRPTDTLTNSPFPSPTATIAATETPKPPETPIPPKPVTITTNLLTSGLTGIGGGNEEAPIPIPTSTSGGGTQKEVPFIDTYGYTQNAWLWDDKSKATDISKDPIKALQYFIALTEMSVVEGGIDFQKLFPKLASPLVFEKMTVNTLPGGNTISAKINAQPQGLEINKMTHMIVVGRYTDRSAGNQVIIAFDDFNRSKIASPRLTLAVLPETIDPSTSAVTSFQDMLKQNGWDYDWAKGVITLPKGKQLLINQIDNVTGQSFADQISDAAGALYVNKRPDGGIYFNPVVPYPTKVLRDKAVSGYAIQNSQPVGLDLNNKPVAQASYDAGSDTWSWKEVKKEPQTLREFGDALNFELSGFIDNTNEIKNTIAQNFNSAVIWVGWKYSEPQQGKFDYTALNYYGNWARQNGLNMRGHMLIWPADLPDWVLNGRFNKDQLTTVMKNHITSLVTPYKGKVKEWVVVNEPYAPPYRLNDIFYETIGPDYIKTAFQIAHEADPSAILIYNDTFNHTSNGITTQLTKNTIINLKEIVGDKLAVGLEMHLGNTLPNPLDVSETMKSYGVPVYVTEFDANNQNAYAAMLNASLSSGICKGFTFWDNQKFATLFDPNSPIYNAILADMKSYYSSKPTS